MTRWLPHAESPDAMARQAAAMLLSFPGTICLYQGEELGQTETDLSYDELTDPPALRFWPEIKGRDGCRTPMVWDDSPHAGFSTAKPWLPVKEPQAARAVAGQQDGNDSVLSAYRATIAFRKSQMPLRVGDTAFLDLPEPILAFHRGTGDQALTCVFNLSPNPATLTLSDKADLTGPSQATLSGRVLSLPPNGFAWLDGPVGLLA